MDTHTPPKRGLSALLASTVKKTDLVSESIEQSGQVFMAELPISTIRPNPGQPRTNFNEASLNELASSIKAQGLVQPIIVRKLKPEEASGTVQYELIAGERRWRAAQLAGLTQVHAIVKSVFSPKDILVLSLVENLQREDLDAIEQAKAYDNLSKASGLKHEEIADAVGKSRATVTNTIRLLELPSSIQDAIKSKHITPAHALILLSVPDSKLQSQLAAKVQART